MDPADHARSEARRVAITIWLLEFVLLALLLRASLALQPALDRFNLGDLPRALLSIGAFLALFAFVAPGLAWLVARGAERAGQPALVAALRSQGGELLRLTRPGRDLISVFLLIALLVLATRAVDALPAPIAALVDALALATIAAGILGFLLRLIVSPRP